MFYSSFKFALFIFLLLLTENAMAITGLEINNLIKFHLSKNGLEGSPSINKKRVFKECQDIHIEKLFENFKTVTVSCKKPFKWEIAVRTNLISSINNSTKKNHTNETNQVLVLNTNLKKGEIIQASDLAYKKFNHSIGNGYFIVQEQLIGRKLKQSLSLGQPIKSRHLEQNWMIEKGQSVIINSNIGSINVIMKGIAEENGHFNEIIKVSNVSSGKIIEGIIINEKKILIKN